MLDARSQGHVCVPDGLALIPSTYNSLVTGNLKLPIQSLQPSTAQTIGSAVLFKWTPAIFPTPSVKASTIWHII